MKILVTGVNGFIGAKLLSRLCILFGEANIVAITSKKQKNIESILYNDLYQIVGNSDEVISDVDVLIHAGSFIPKNRAQSDLFELCNSNVTFTDALLKLNFRKLKKIVYLSTVDVYDDDKIYSESSPVKPISLYGHSKFYCEMMIDAYCRQRGVDWHILRVGHVYGPGEECYEKLLPLAIKKILSGKAVDVWGSGDEIRTFIYVEDVVTACVNAINVIDMPTTINVVGSNSISIQSLLNKVSVISGCELKINYKHFIGKSRNLIFDNSELKKYLLPVETEFEIGLSTEIEYLKAIN